jgi:hypothetical protein
MGVNSRMFLMLCLQIDGDESDVGGTDINAYSFHLQHFS